ncbi:hypothetical protein KR018_009778 [Drosophila ironensis]|nr:hypothetical protein KR018_009778 [Drosophila ironensis]
MDNSVDFGKLSSKLYGNYSQLALSLKELCVSKSVIKPPAFFESLQRQIDDEARNTTPSQDLGSVADYAELFRALDEYPANLQKSHPKKRELQRANSTFLKGADADVTANLNTSNLSLSMSRLEEQRSAVEIYGDFKGFQRKLAKVYEEAAALDTIETIQTDKLAQIRGFAQQLEKLLPSGEGSPTEAFTAAEQETLLAIAANMEQLNYLRSHSPQMPNLGEIVANGSLAARLEMYVEVLSYALMQISIFTLV